MIRRPPRSTRTDPLFPYPTLFRSPFRQSGNLRLALALPLNIFGIGHRLRREGPVFDRLALRDDVVAMRRVVMIVRSHFIEPPWFARLGQRPCQFWDRARNSRFRSEEHTSELQSLMRISYAVFCLKKKTIHITI